MSAMSDPSLDQAPPKKRELPTKKNTSVKNMAWAMGLNLILAAIIAVAVVGLGRDNEQKPSAGSVTTVNIAESAGRAQETLPFPVAKPEMGEGWRPIKARQGGSGESGTWTVQQRSASGELLTFVQGSEYGPAITQLMGGEYRASGEEQQIGGADCEWFDGDDKRIALGCDTGDSGFVVYGGTNREDTAAFAEKAARTAQ